MQPTITIVQCKIKSKIIHKILKTKRKKWKAFDCIAIALVIWTHGMINEMASHDGILRLKHLRNKSGERKKPRQDVALYKNVLLFYFILFLCVPLCLPLTVVLLLYSMVVRQLVSPSILYIFRSIVGLLFSWIYY